MKAGSWELVAGNESTVIPKSKFDATVVEDSEGDTRFADASCTNESDWFEVFSETNDLLD